MKLIALLAAVAAIGISAAAFAGEPITIVIKDHKFSPDVVEVPAGEKVKLIVDNQDASAEEFESFELKREKIIAGNSQATIFIGPLEAGEYPFFGEFNPDTAQGKVIAK